MDKKFFFGAINSVSFYDFDLEEELAEIKEMQDEIDCILYNKNPLIKIFYLRKAGKLIKEVKKRLDRFGIWMK